MMISGDRTEDVIPDSRPRTQRRVGFAVAPEDDQKQGLHFKQQWGRIALLMEMMVMKKMIS